MREIGSKYSISIEPKDSIAGIETRVFQAAHNVFGGATVSVFIGIEDGVTVVRMVGYEVSDAVRFMERLDALRMLLNDPDKK